MGRFSSMYLSERRNSARRALSSNVELVYFWKVLVHVEKACWLGDGWMTFSEISELALWRKHSAVSSREIWLTVFTVLRLFEGGTASSFNHDFFLSLFLNPKIWNLSRDAALDVFGEDASEPEREKKSNICVRYDIWLIGNGSWIIFFEQERQRRKTGLKR